MQQITIPPKMETIVNKVAESGIITLDLVTWLPKEEVVLFDLKPFLFREMILREKDYRAALPLHDWAQYAGKHVAIHCTADAIIGGPFAFDDAIGRTAYALVDRCAVALREFDLLAATKFF